MSNSILLESLRQSGLQVDFTDKSISIVDPTKPDEDGDKPRLLSSFDLKARRSIFDFVAITVNPLLKATGTEVAGLQALLTSGFAVEANGSTVVISNPGNTETPEVASIDLGEVQDIADFFSALVAPALLAAHPVPELSEESHD